MLWYGEEPRFSSAPSRALNHDGTPALTRGELAERLLEIAEQDDDGEPKTGRRFYYLALSHGYIKPDMSDTAEGKRSRDAAYDRVTSVLGILRKQGRLPWAAVLDLTRDLDEWRTYESPREARAALRRNYDEDRWLGQPYYPILIVEKDTMEPVCQPMAQHWQMPFASSRGYSSLRLQYDVARMLRRRHAKTGQRAIIFFVSDLDPSGLDLQRAWENALANFGAPEAFIRIGLTREQVRDNRDVRGRPLTELSIEVKASDSRSRSFIAQYGNRCWETDVLPPAIIRQALDHHIHTWLNHKLWQRRDSEIERTRSLL
jgi:hypothetical protein